MGEYKPSESVLARLQTVRFAAVVGPSGVGKTTLISAALQQDPELHIILSDTTRPPRPNEQDGVDYNFRTAQVMYRDIENCAFINVARSVNGVDMYATHPSSLPHEGIGIMAVLAEVVDELRALPFASFRTVCIVPSSFEMWQSRIAAHQFSQEQLDKRMGEARRSLEWMKQASDIYFVINDAIAIATEDFIAMSRGDHITERQQVDQVRARSIIDSLLAQI